MEHGLFELKSDFFFALPKSSIIRYLVHAIYDRVDTDVMRKEALLDIASKQRLVQAIC